MQKGGTFLIKTDEDRKKYYKEAMRWLQNPLRYDECPKCHHSFIDRQERKLRTFRPQDLGKEFDVVTKYFTGNRKRASVNYLGDTFCTYRLWSKTCRKFGVKNYFYLYECSTCRGEFYGPNWYEISFNSKACNIIFGIISGIFGLCMGIWYTALIGLISAASLFIALWILFLIIWKNCLKENKKWAEDQNIKEYNHCVILKRIDDEERAEYVLDQQEKKDT